MAAANGRRTEEKRAGGIGGPTNPMVTPLLTDLYQFTMAYAYWKGGKQNERAVFDLYFRRNPFGEEYTVFAGLEECIKLIANFRFTEVEISFIRSSLPASCEIFIPFPSCFPKNRPRKESPLIFIFISVLNFAGFLGVFLGDVKQSTCSLQQER